MNEIIAKMNQHSLVAALNCDVCHLYLPEAFQWITWDATLVNKVLLMTKVWLKAQKQLCGTVNLASKLCKYRSSSSFMFNQHNRTVSTHRRSHVSPPILLPAHRPVWGWGRRAAGRGSARAARPRKSKCRLRPSGTRRRRSSCRTRTQTCWWGCGSSPRSGRGWTCTRPPPAHTCRHRIKDIKDVSLCHVRGQAGANQDLYMQIPSLSLLGNIFMKNAIGSYLDSITCQQHFLQSPNWLHGKQIYGRHWQWNVGEMHVKQHRHRQEIHV